MRSKRAGKRIIWGVSFRSVLLASVLAGVLVLLGCGPKPAKIRHPPNLAAGQRAIRYNPNAHVFHTTTGMTVLVLPERNTNLVKVDVRYRVGAAEDPPGKSGLAHLVEHMLFEARLDGPKTPTLGELMSRVALYRNAHTIWDETHFTSVAFSDELPALLGLEARRMSTRCKQLHQGDFVRERDVVRSELRQRTTIASLTDQLLRRAAYGGAHPYARPIGGTEQDVASITRKDVCRFLDAHYGANAAILVVSGNVEPAAVVEQINKLFRGVSRQSSAPRTEIPAPRARGSQAAYTLAVDEASALIAFPAAPFLSDEWAYDRLLVSILDGHLSDIASEHDELTSLAVGTTGGLEVPLVVIALSVASPERLNDMIALVYRETERFTEGFDEDALTILRERRRAELLFRVEPFMRKASMFADYAQYADHDLFVLRDLDLLGNLRLDVLKSRAKRVFVRAGSQVVAIRPEPGERPKAERAQVRFVTGARSEDDRHDDHVDLAEAEKSLPVPERGVDTAIRAFTLDNGLNVLLAPHLSHPVVDIRLVFPAGELHDPPDKPGLSFWALHLLEANQPRFERLRDLNDMLTIIKMGGTWSRWMDERTTTFRITGQGPHVDGLLWNLHWLVENGIYGGSSLRQMRSLLSRKQSEEDIENRHRMEAILETLYGAGHPYAMVSRAREVPQRISTSDLEQFRSTHYRMGGATLIVAGSFDTVLVESEVRRLFGHWAAAEAPPRRQVPDAVARTESQYLAVLDEDAYRVRLSVAFDTRPGFTTDHAAFLVLREMLRDELGLLREALGITYDVSVSQVSREGPGLLLVSTEIDREHAAEAFRVMRDTLDALRAGKHTAAFVRARRRVLQGLLADALSSTSVAGELEMIVTYDLPRSYYDELARRVATLRPADVQALVDRDLAPAHQVVLVMGDRATVEALYEAVGISRYRRVE